MSPHQVSSSKGFTLIETLVAIAVLGVGLIPAFIQASSALSLSQTVRNSLTATYLAQEGIETIRAMRDANWFAGDPFGQGISDACAGGCQVQWDKAEPLQLADPSLKLDPVTGLYQYDTGTDTGFHRTVTTTSISAHELKVVVSIDWRDRTGDKKFEVEDHLYDWLK